MNVIEQYQAHLLSRDKSPKTIQGYGADLRQFKKIRNRRDDFQKAIWES